MADYPLHTGTTRDMPSVVNTPLGELTQPQYANDAIRELAERLIDTSQGHPESLLQYQEQQGRVRGTWNYWMARFASNNQNGNNQNGQSVEGNNGTGDLTLGQRESADTNRKYAVEPVKMAPYAAGWALRDLANYHLGKPEYGEILAEFNGLDVTNPILESNMHLAIPPEWYVRKRAREEGLTGVRGMIRKYQAWKTAQLDADRREVEGPADETFKYLSISSYLRVITMTPDRSIHVLNDGVIKGNVNYWAERFSEAWKSYQRREAGSGRLLDAYPAVESTGTPLDEQPRDEKKPGVVARKLSANVKRNLENGRTSRYLALKADTAYRLDPTAETALMAADANFRVYDRTKDERRLEKHLAYLADPTRRGQFRNDIAELAFGGEPDEMTIRRAAYLASVDTERPVQSNIYLAVANARLFNELPDDPQECEEKRLSLLRNAVEAARHAVEAARHVVDVASDTEITEAVSYLDNTRSMLQDYDQHVREKRLVRSRNSVAERVFTAEPEDVILDAEELVGMDYQQPLTARVYAAVAQARMFNKTREPNHLNKAKEHVDLAMTNVTEADVPFVSPVREDIYRMLRELDDKK